MRFRGGSSDALFDGAGALWTGFGDAVESLATGDGAEGGAGAEESSEDRISLSKLMLCIDKS